MRGTGNQTDVGLRIAVDSAFRWDLKRKDYAKTSARKSDRRVSRDEKAELNERKRRGLKR